MIDNSPASVARAWACDQHDKSLRQLVDSMEQAALALNVHGCIVVGNAAMATLLGRSDLRGDHLVSLVTPAQQGRTERLLVAAREFSCNAVLEIATEPPTALPVRVQALNGHDTATLLLVAECGCELHELRKVLAQERDRREQLELALDAAELGVWSANPATGEMQGDQRTRQMHGVQVDACLTRELVMQAVHPDDRVAIFETMHDALQRAQNFECRYRTLNTGSPPRWLLMRGCWLAATATRPAKRVGVVQDITESMAAEATLREREQALHVVLTNAHVSVFEQDLDLRYVWVLNSRLGITDRHSLACQTDADIMAPEAADALMAVKRRAIETGLPVREDVSAGLPGQPLKHYDMYIEPRRDSSGRIVGIICAGSEITELDRARQAVAYSERLYRSLFDHMFHGLAFCRLVYDGDRPVDWRYLEVNPAFLRMTGFQDAKGRLVSEVLPGLLQANPQVFEAYGRVASTGRSEQFESEVASLGRWIRVSAYCPKPGHFVALFDDITERRQAEVVLAERTREAEEANNAKSRFLSSVSHELRTPLHAMLGYLRLLAKTCRGDQLRQALAAERGALQLERLIKDLLSFSLDPSQAGTLDPTATELRHLLAQVDDFGRQAAAANANRFRLVRDPALPATLLVDEQRLSQVLHNLVDNACKYTRQGSVTLLVERVDSGSPATPGLSDTLRFAVVDTGEGIAPLDQARIFEAFQRGSGVQLQPGMGLGLAIARHWVDAMGGTLELVSASGRGSSFQFTLVLPVLADTPACALSVRAETSTPVVDPAPTPLLSAAELVELGALISLGRLPRLAQWAADLARREPDCASWAAELMHCCDTIDLVQLDTLAAAALEAAGAGLQRR